MYYSYNIHNNTFLLVSHYPDFLITSYIHVFEKYVQSIVLYGLSMEVKNGLSVVQCFVLFFLTNCRGVKRSAFLVGLAFSWRILSFFFWKKAEFLDGGGRLKFFQERLGAFRDIPLTHLRPSNHIEYQFWNNRLYRWKVPKMTISFHKVKNEWSIL